MTTNAPEAVRKIPESYRSLAHTEETRVIDSFPMVHTIESAAAE